MKKTKLPADPAAQLRALIERTSKPGAYMLMYAHDTWCPAGDSQGKATCVCQPDVYLATEFDQPKAGTR